MQQQQQQQQTTIKLCWKTKHTNWKTVWSTMHQTDSAKSTIVWKAEKTREKWAIEMCLFLWENIALLLILRGRERANVEERGFSFALGWGQWNGYLERCQLLLHESNAIYWVLVPICWRHFSPVLWISRLFSLINKSDPLQFQSYCDYYATREWTKKNFVIIR